MTAALLVLVLAAAAPLIAIGSEVFLHLAPCELCLWQRWPYWAAAGFAALGLLLPAGLRAALLALAGVAALVSGGIAMLHVGVEQHWWPSPLPACLAQGGTGARSVEELMRGLAAVPNKPCDEPAYLIEGLPVSMAAMNVLYAVGLAGLVLVLLRRGAWR